MGDKIKLTNEFNAVKINVMKGEHWHNSSGATSYYFVYIDDGREQTDNYLNIPQGGYVIL
ncbi:hypothetical protein QIU18_09435 [Capnocytophaga canimorsus]|nr:hypothetical protein [Capnocytophaga canimorsus]WGU69818.1 hypothetical protein QIU18_09435 [Capnocytophaga canimorsus]